MRRDDFALCRAQILIDRDKLDAVNDDTIPLGHWVEIPPMSIRREYDFDSVGKKDMYLLHHEEIESLAENIPDVQRIRFFMTFGQSYLTHMKCLENVGGERITPEILDYIEYAKLKGCSMTGPEDPDILNLNVLV